MIRAKYYDSNKNISQYQYKELYLDIKNKFYKRNKYIRHLFIYIINYVGIWIGGYNLNQ
jgi:hypothetical protein